VQYSIGYMGIGAILDTAVNVLKENLGLLLSISAVTLIPVQLVFGFVIHGSYPELKGGDPRVFQEHPELMIVLAVNLIVLLFLMMPLVNGATIHGIASAYLSRPASLGDCLKFGFRRWPALVGTTILMFLAIWGGLFMCIVPGIFLALWFMLSQHVVVLENLSGPSALVRSKDLIKGETGKVFVLSLILTVVNVSLSGIGTLIPQPQLQLIAQAVLSAVLTTFASCAFTIFYFSCRCKHENFDLQMLAQSVEQS
jgi:hypothetical protein